MGHIYFTVLFAALALAAALLLVFRRDMLDALLEAIDRFRGGPRTPMHPSPRVETYHC